MSNTIVRDHLRPVERRVLEMQQEGMAVEEIAARLNRSPEFVGRMLGWTEIPRNGTGSERDLTPRQRRVLDMRAEGRSHAEIADRFRKGEAYIRQVEGLAHFKESQRLLTRG
jgi:DNA-binding CsgD family transcriptional regulator